MNTISTPATIYKTAHAWLKSEINSRIEQAQHNTQDIEAVKFYIEQLSKIMNSTEEPKESTDSLTSVIIGGSWLDKPLKRTKREKPQKIKEGLTQEEIDFLKSTLNKELEMLHSDIEYYRATHHLAQNREDKELFLKLKLRDNALIKKLAEIQRKLKRGLPTTSTKNIK
jgi:hypothetical protein